MANGNPLEQLEQFDQIFAKIYEGTRARTVEQQQKKALIVIDGDELLLYRRNHPVQRFPGLQPPLYNKMKTLGHVPLAIYCLLYDQTDKLLTDDVLANVSAYRAAIERNARNLDTSEEADRGTLRQPSLICAKATALLDTAIARRGLSGKEFAAFIQETRDDIASLLAAAARAQLDACDALVTHIRQDVLSKEQWQDLRVLVLGPYMARQGELFLQYFSQLLDTPMQGDRRLVYYDGEDLEGAFDRLGTIMLDSAASDAIFGDRERMHRDVLADETTLYLQDLATGRKLN